MSWAEWKLLDDKLSLSSFYGEKRGANILAVPKMNDDVYDNKRVDNSLINTERNYRQTVKYTINKLPASYGNMTSPTAYIDSKGYLCLHAGYSRYKMVTDSALTLVTGSAETSSSDNKPDVFYDGSIYILDKPKTIEGVTADYTILVNDEDYSEKIACVCPSDITNTGSISSLLFKHYIYVITFLADVFKIYRFDGKKWQLMVIYPKAKNANTFGRPMFFKHKGYIYINYLAAAGNNQQTFCYRYDGESEIIDITNSSGLYPKIEFAIANYILGSITNYIDDDYVICSVYGNYTAGHVTFLNLSQYNDHGFTQIYTLNYAYNTGYEQLRGIPAILSSGRACIPFYYAINAQATNSHELLFLNITDAECYIYADSNVHICNLSYPYDNKMLTYDLSTSSTTETKTFYRPELPYQWPKKFFYYNDHLYLVCQNKIYDVTNYESGSENPDVFVTSDYNFSDGQILIYNDEIHCFGGIFMDRSHIKISSDGSRVTRPGIIPTNIGIGYVENDEMYLFTNDKIYKYNPSATFPDVWEEYLTHNHINLPPFGYSFVMFRNGKKYIFCNDNVYKEMDPTFYIQEKWSDTHIVAGFDADGKNYFVRNYDLDFASINEDKAATPKVVNMDDVDMFIY